MQVLRALTALDESGPEGSSLASEPQLTCMLVCTLAMLAALNAIQPPRRRSQPPQQTPAHTAQQPPNLNQSQQVSQSAKHERGTPGGPQQGPVNGQSHHLLNSCWADGLQSTDHSQSNFSSASHATPPSLAGCDQAAADQSGQIKDVAASIQLQQRQDAYSAQLQSQTSDQPDKSLPATHSMRAQGQAASQGRPAQADQQQPDVCYAVEQTVQQQRADSPEELIRLAEHYPKQSPYKGYRCDMVALLANLCFRRPAVHHKVQQLGGVELILSQCQV